MVQFYLDDFRIGNIFINHAIGVNHWRFGCIADDNSVGRLGHSFISFNDSYGIIAAYIHQVIIVIMDGIAIIDINIFREFSQDQRHGHRWGNTVIVGIFMSQNQKVFHRADSIDNIIDDGIFLKDGFYWFFCHNVLILLQASFHAHTALFLPLFLAS